MRLEDIQRVAAFRASNGECGWTREQGLNVIAILRNQLLAILGGELWMVLNGSSNWTGLIPQREGPDAVYAWETKRYPKEDWTTDVNWCAADSRTAVEKWLDSDNLSPNMKGRILYNFT
jgi:hypothetical protein